MEINKLFDAIDQLKRSKKKHLKHLYHLIVALFNNYISVKINKNNYHTINIISTNLFLLNYCCLNNVKYEKSLNNFEFGNFKQSVFKFSNFHRYIRKILKYQQQYVLKKILIDYNNNLILANNIKLINMRKETEQKRKNRQQNEVVKLSNTLSKSFNWMNDICHMLLNGDSFIVKVSANDGVYISPYPSFIKISQMLL